MNLNPMQTVYIPEKLYKVYPYMSMISGFIFLLCADSLPKVLVPTIISLYGAVMALRRAL